PRRQCAGGARDHHPVVPGTVWLELSIDRERLLLHVFDLPDAPAFISYYKSRYERLLQEIFE
ncbi:MAG: Na+/H+ antiporter subunit E, partial [Lautropia sp.]